jgi:hypothetical protein
LGSFLRLFTFGHVRQRDAVASRSLTNLAEQTPLVSGIHDTDNPQSDDPDGCAGGHAGGHVLVDVDDTIIEVHGYSKQAAGFGYSGVRGLNVPLATVTTGQAAPVILTVAAFGRPSRCGGAGVRWGYSSPSPCWADFLRSSRQWISWVFGCRHSRIRYSKPGSSTIGIGSGDAGATAPTTILASAGMNGDCAGMGAVTISTGSP